VNSPPHADAYRRTVLREFAALKSIDRFDDAVFRSLRLPNGRGYLLCVSELHAEDDITIDTLSRFRAGVTTFPGTFRVTNEGTKRWLRAGLLDVPDRILFFVLGRTGQVVGHLGFAHADNTERRMELDNVIRGVAGIQPGLMADATERLIEWANATFSPAEIHLRVLDDNDRAIAFYGRLGFVRSGSEPLRRQESNGEVRYVPLPTSDRGRPDRFYACMRLDRSSDARREPLLRSA
jgi:RimJ/RimL family protein N-acetyltransferase